MPDCKCGFGASIPGFGTPGGTFVPQVRNVPEGLMLGWENNRGLENPAEKLIPTGLSAYELAVRNGFEGTEKEWVDSLWENARQAQAAAEAAKAAAETAQSGAEKSTAAADQSAQNAGASEQNATTSERNAKASETDAGQSATAAANSAAAASRSAGSAAASEQNAKASEVSAAGSAKAAAKSEQAAADFAEEARKTANFVPAPVSAQPGQLLVVEEVDAAGKITKVKPMDRTHWVETVTINPTFDGDMTGRETIMIAAGTYAVKVSPEYVSVGDMIGATLIFDMGGAEEEILLPAQAVIDAALVLGVAGSVVLMGSEPIVLSLPADSIIQGATLTAGTWFMCIPGQSYIKSLSCLQHVERETVHKLDNKFIDAKWMAKMVLAKGTVLWEEVERTSNIANHYVEDVRGNTMNLLPDQAYVVVYSGVEFMCRSAVLSNEGGLSSICLGNLALGVESDGTSSGASTGEPFLIVYIPSEEFLQIVFDSLDKGTPFTMGIYNTTEVADKLPEEYLPESVDGIVIRSSTEGSTKRFKLTVDDKGAVTATEVM